MNDMMKEVVNYHLNRGLDRYEDAVEEAIHGIMIYGLSQGGAFYKLAFRCISDEWMFRELNGTSDRMFFVPISEKEPDLERYYPILRDRLEPFGLEMESEDNGRGMKTVNIYSADEMDKGTLLSTVKMKITRKEIDESRIVRKVLMVPFIHTVALYVEGASS